MQASIVAHLEDIFKSVLSGKNSMYVRLHEVNKLIN